VVVVVTPSMSVAERQRRIRPPFREGRDDEVHGIGVTSLSEVLDEVLVRGWDGATAWPPAWLRPSDEPTPQS
jgi:hypothetical protein